MPARADVSTGAPQVLGLPAMAPDWEEGRLSWADVPNLKPLAADDVVIVTRHNFIRQALRAGCQTL